MGTLKDDDENINKLTSISDESHSAMFLNGRYSERDSTRLAWAFRSLKPPPLYFALPILTSYVTTHPAKVLA